MKRILTSRGLTQRFMKIQQCYRVHNPLVRWQHGGRHFRFRAVILLIVLLISLQRHACADVCVRYGAAGEADGVLSCSCRLCALWCKQYAKRRWRIHLLQAGCLWLQRVLSFLRQLSHPGPQPQAIGYGHYCRRQCICGDRLPVAAHRPRAWVIGRVEPCGAEIEVGFSAT